MKKLAAAALAGVMVLTFGMTAMAEGDVLVMATNAEFPPYEYREGDDIVGIDAEVAGLIAEKLGMELQIEDMAFDSVLAAVQTGKADIAMAGITVTEDRQMMVNFTDTYTKATQMIIVTEDSEIASPDDLTGKTIGVQLGTTGDIYVDDIEDATAERFSKGFEAVQALLQGKVDAVVIDGEPAKVFVSQNEGLKLWMIRLLRKSMQSQSLRTTKSCLRRSIQH